MPAGSRATLIVVLSGGLSAAMTLPVQSGSVWRLLFLGLACLPLFAAGLGEGILAAAGSGTTAATLVGLAMGLRAGVLFALGAALPVVILVGQALRRSPAPRSGDARGRPLWSNGGGLLLCLTSLGLVGALGVVGFYALFEGGLEATIAERFELAPAAAHMVARIAPGIAMAAWMVALAVDGAIAEWLLLLKGVHLRPPVDIKRLALPIWIGPALMVTGLAGAWLRQGWVGILCLNSAIVLVVPFAFLGLATLHAVAGDGTAGRWLVRAAYVVLLATPTLLGWPALMGFGLLLAGVGTVDQLMDFRGLRGLRSGMTKK